jgi:hypothetical protein
MSSRAGTTASAALACAFVAVVVTGGPALAVPEPTIPADVRAVFGGEALRQTQAAEDGLEMDFSGAVRVDDIHEVFWFTADVLDGVPTSEPVTSSDQWLASIKHGDEVLGILWVSRPPGDPARWAGTSNDSALGTALTTVSASEILIADEPNGAYYALDGTTVRPLNNWARQVLPEPGNISGLQETIADQYALMREQATDYPDIPSVAISLAGMAGAIVVGGLLLVLGRRRRRVQAP